MLRYVCYVRPLSYFKRPCESLSQLKEMNELTKLNQLSVDADNTNTRIAQPSIKIISEDALHRAEKTLLQFPHIGNKARKKEKNTRFLIFRYIGI